MHIPVTTTPIPRETVLPPRDRSFLLPGNAATGGLRYLAWGERRFGLDPIPLRRHAGWVFTAIVAGSARLLLESGARRLAAATAFVAGPDSAYGWAGRRNERCSILVWMWDRPVTRHFSGHGPVWCGRFRLRRQDVRALAAMHELCRHELQQPDEASEAVLHGCQQITEGLFARARQPRSESDPAAARLTFALGWLRNHLDSPEPAARLGDYLGISLSTLHRLFKRGLGESPSAAAQRLRLEAARHWLQTETVPVKEIAYRLGYRHFSDFSRAFKARHGRPPTAVRRQAR